jgi:putative Mg2+ transporter-C (MgtC) family protein
MDTTIFDYFSVFWNIEQLRINLYLVLNLLGALFLGMLVGYERSFHGRAAGMRTYGLVCMASAALTAFHAYVPYWFGGNGVHVVVTDPTRVIQGVVTGIGFLGAGVIMKDGLSISGLTTAASIWASCAIGILVGVGFYSAAIALSITSAAVMVFVPRLENLLPVRRAVGVQMEFDIHDAPPIEVIKTMFNNWDYHLAEGSLQIKQGSQTIKWSFVIVSICSHPKVNSLFEISEKLNQYGRCFSYQLEHARN